MNRDQIIAVLRQHEAELHRKGVRHAALFGSVARGEERPGSDIDIAIELDPATTEHLGFFGYAGIKLFVAGLFSGKVDVVNRARLKPRIKDDVEGDLVHAF